MDDAYTRVVTGSLFGSTENKKKKRKKDKKVKKSSKCNDSDSKRLKQNVSSDEDDDLSDLTPAQRKYELAMRVREKERIAKMISKTHREKINEFNDKLEKLSEHHDIPKTGAAGNG